MNMRLDGLQCPLCPNSDQILRRQLDGPLCAKSGLMQCSKNGLLFYHLVGAGEQREEEISGAGWEIKYPSESTGTKATPAR